MSNSAFTKIFSPTQFLAGVAVSLGGVVFFVWLVLFATHVRLKSVVIGGAAVVLGGGLVATCRRDACASCKKQLSPSAMPFPRELDGQVRSAVAALGRGDMSALSALESAPVDAFRAPVATELLLWHCTQCVQVGRVHSAKREHLAQGGSRHSESSAEVDVVGANVKLLVELMTRRNEASTRLAGYST